MDMRDLLLEVAAKYDFHAGTRAGVPGQILLRGIEKRQDLSLPPGCMALGRGGQGTAATTPWIGVFDPEITTDPKEGLYLAYIFGADLTSVTLTVQQGTTRLEERLGRGLKLREHLAHKAAQLSEQLPVTDRDGWLEKPRFGDQGNRPRAYEASSVAARRYELAALPGELELQSDLAHAVGLLRAAAVAEERSLWIEEGSIPFEVGYTRERHSVMDPLGGFHPKDSSDYIANIPARQQIKSRKHEALIDEFGQHVLECGYSPTTAKMHPRDLILHLTGAAEEDPEWLVEAKVVRSGNPTIAVREAMGQLYEYRYFYYRELGRPDPYLLALFASDIGIYSQYLEEHGIASLWRTEGGWQGSPLAVEWAMGSAS